MLLHPLMNCSRHAQTPLLYYGSSRSSLLRIAPVRKDPLRPIGQLVRYQASTVPDSLEARHCRLPHHRFRTMIITSPHIFKHKMADDRRKQTQARNVANALNVREARCNQHPRHRKSFRNRPCTRDRQHHVRGQPNPAANYISLQDHF